MSMHDNTPAAIAARLLATFRRQLATSRQGRALAAAGMAELTDELGRREGMPVHVMA